MNVRERGRMRKQEMMGQPTSRKSMGTERLMRFRVLFTWAHRAGKWNQRTQNDFHATYSINKVGVKRANVQKAHK